MNNNDIFGTGELGKKIVEETVEIVKEPIKDVINPLFQNLGLLMETVFFPVKILHAYTDFKYEKFREGLHGKISEIPPDNLTNGRISIIGPILEACKYYMDEDEMREMFTELLASSVNTEKEKYVHPSFVEIIKQLSSFDAKVLQELYVKEDSYACGSIVENQKPSGITYLLHYYFPFKDITFDNYNEYNASVDNLIRLHIINFDSDKKFTQRSYDELNTHPLLRQFHRVSKNFSFYPASWRFTPMGINFVKSCLPPRPAFYITDIRDARDIRS